MSDDITAQLDDPDTDQTEIELVDDECDDPACCPTGGDHYAREIDE